MEEAYANAKSEDTLDEVTELTHKKRGGPVFLGELVYEHLAGGIIIRHIVIATACCIVLHDIRSFLADNGGSINKTWSYSFLIRYRFVKREAAKAARKIPPGFQKK